MRTRLVIPKIVFAVMSYFMLGLLGGILICLRVGEALIPVMILVVAGVLLVLMFLALTGVIDAGLPEWILWGHTGDVRKRQTDKFH